MHNLLYLARKFIIKGAYFQRDGEFGWQKQFILQLGGSHQSKMQPMNK